MNKKEMLLSLLNWISIIACLAAAGFLLWVQVTHINFFAASWDQVDFSLALDRYDLMAMQPHFPGYPYFIVGGKIVHLWMVHPPAALTLFNILFYFSALLPVYKLARKHFSGPRSLLLAVLLYSSSYTLVIVNQPMSEGAALACLWWFLWSLDQAFSSNSRIKEILPLFLLSLLLGIRLSYLPFSIGLVYLFYQKKYGFKKAALHVSVAALFQLIWVGALVISEGSLKGFIKLSLAFTSGHFNSWGNTAVSSSVSFAERVKTLVFENMFWTGLFAQSLFLCFFYLLFIMISFFSRKANFRYPLLVEKQVLLLSAAYFLWALFAQNIDKPRHILPVVMLFLFLLLIQLMKKQGKVVVVLALLILLLGQTVHSSQLIKKQASQKPATYQLADYLKQLGEPAVIYAWEEVRVLEYLDVPVPYNEVETYEVFLHDQSYYQNRNIFLTDKVLKEFKTQEKDVMKHVKKVKEFKSEAMFNPVYDRIVLYEWKPEKKGEK